MTEDETEALRREFKLRWEAHDALHQSHDKSHDREHAMTTDALDKAAGTMEKRLEGMNEFRDQLRAQAATFATLATSDEAHRGLGVRIDELRERVVNLEKVDSEQKGKTLGQGATIALIVAAVGFVGTVLGIIVLLANLATSP